MEITKALAAARANSHGVLVTMRRNGRPQLSNILQTVDDDGVVRISTTADRAKYHNLLRDPWAALKVDGDSFFSYAVLEGEAQLSSVAQRPDDGTVEELVAMYRALSGEHPDWDDYRAAMVRDRRLVVRLRPTYAYGQLR